MEEMYVKKFKRMITTAIATAMVMTVFTPMTAMASNMSAKKTVTGLITISGGNGRMEDVTVSIRYGANSDSDKEWTGTPDSNGRYSIPTDVSIYSLAVLSVKAELPGYASASKSIFMGEDSADLILVADDSATAFNIGGFITLDGGALPANLCPVVNFNVTNLAQDKDLAFCGGTFICAAPAGCDVVVTPSLEGYSFSPESFRIDKISDDVDDILFTMTKVEASVPETEAPPAAEETPAPEETPAEEETPKAEESSDTVTLYFMTGSSPEDPGEVYAQYEVPKNSRKNTTTISNTIGSSKPKKEGYAFSHWQERSLTDPSKLGNKVSGVIWTNETDQYIYAQYTQNVKLYFMTGSSPDAPGEVFAEFEVPMNSRGNTTTVAKTIKTAVPCKVGCEFSHWREANGNELGNKISGVIWTNESDKYIYAQYK